LNSKINDSSKISLTIRTMKATLWSGASKFAGLGLQIGIGAFLARLLFPEDFGLIGMVAVFSGIVGLFRELGLGSAIIQKKDATEEHLSSVFFINILAGVILSLVMVILAPEIAYFYNEKRLMNITMVLGTRFFISSFGIVQRTLLTKKLEFKKIAIIEMSSEALAGVLAIFLAFWGMGVWSLVLQTIVSNTISVILLWLWSSWRPSFIFHWSRLKELSRFSLNLLGFSFVNYFSRNLDNLLIGKYLGAASLGFYGKAYSFMLMPIYNISWTMNDTLFPAFSQIQEDIPKIREKYMQITRYISMLTFPLMMGLMVLAPEFIRILYGNKWERSIILLQILCPVGMMQSILTTVGCIFLSQGRTDIQFKWSIFSTVAVTISFLVGIRWDIEGVAIAYCIISFILMFPNFFIAFRLINLPIYKFFRNLLLTLVSAIGMAIIVFGCRMYLKISLQANDVVTFITCFVVGVASYVGLICILGRKLLQEFFELVMHLKNPSKISSEVEFAENS